MQIQSLGLRSDLIFPRFEGEVIDRGDYIVVRTPANPGYCWGNYLLFPAAPVEGDYERWTSLFARELGNKAGIEHIALTWDGVDGTEGEIAPFLAAGFELSRCDILTADSVRQPPSYRADLNVRRFADKREWDISLAEHIADRDDKYSLESYSNFQRRQKRRFRAMVDAGRGAWFGAFDRERQLGDLGLFHDGDLGRFREVLTYPAFRRRGVCSTLVYEVSRYALTTLGIANLVIVAEEDSVAAAIYRSLGFELREHSVELLLNV